MPVEFHDYSIRVQEALNDAALQFLEEAASEIQSQAQRKTSVDSGQLKGAWGHSVDNSVLEATVGNTLENAIWEEFGTGTWAEGGKGRKDAWYVPVEAVSGSKKPTFNGQVVIVYGQNGQAFYKTNGKKPKRMLHNAFTENKAKIIRRAEQIFKGRMS